MTIAQLREEAKRQKRKIPSNLRRKADIAAFLKGESGGGKEGNVRDLSDADLLKQFEAEIAKDVPDESVMKRLGDELDRRDGEGNVKGFSDDDLLKRFQDEIGKD